MNPALSNPLMFILEADPEKYIKTPSASVVAIIKTLEGFAAFLCCFRVLDILKGLVTSRAPLSLSALFRALVPVELSVRLLPGTLTAPGGTVWTLLSALAALAVLAELVCFVIEAGAGLFLRFALGGAKLMKSTRGAVSAASVLLALCVTGSSALLIWEGVRGGVGLDGSLRLLLVPLGCSLLLWLHVLYNREAAAVFDAVEYEIRLGFKQTALETHGLGRWALLLCLCSFAGAAVLCVFGDFRMRTVYLLAILGCKFFAVWRCFRVFRKCHR